MTNSAQTTLVIFGASGDLTRRLLLPGLASLMSVEPERQVQVVGADRSQMDPAQWQHIIHSALTEADVDASRVEAVAASAQYVQADLLRPDELASLVSGRDDGLVLYFALPPQVSIQLCGLLEDIDLPDGTRLALEKPFGHDYASAQELNRQVLRVVDEEHIHRVDHFLGVNTVLNLIGLRFANRLLQPLWSAEHIESVQITYDETLALEGRAGYYDRAGALVDMLQSHLLQVMAIFAMEAPSALTSVEVQALKAQVLRATEVWQGDPSTASRRARYTAGHVQGHDVPDYATENGVDPELRTETLAEVTLAVKNARWAGVPFTLRSGKALGEKTKRIVVTFREPPHVPTGLVDSPGPDQLVLDLKPGAVSLWLSMNAEGDPFDLEHKQLRAELGKARMLPYGEVLAGIFDGDPLLSIRGDVAEQCWRVMAPVLDAWREGSVALDTYPAGSIGPSSWPR